MPKKIFKVSKASYDLRKLISTILLGFKMELSRKLAFMERTVSLEKSERKKENEIYQV